MINDENRIKVLTRIGVALLIIILVWGGFSLYHRYTTVAVEVKMAPSAASLSIDGKKAKPGTKRLSKKNHTFTATMKGFTDFQQTINISKDSSPVIVLLKPANEETLKWLGEDPEGQKVQLQREDLGGQSAALEGESIEEKNPIMGHLPWPFNQKRFAIDYEITDRSPTGAVVQITAASPQSRQYALDQIRIWGFDPAELVIEYFDFKNPLASEVQ